MYVVFAEELTDEQDVSNNTVQNLEQAFARIACRCGYDYHFEPEESGWKLVLTDVERPDCSPEPVVTTYIKPRDAKHDLMAQAVDGRLKGHIAISYDDFMKSRLRSA